MVKDFFGQELKIGDSVAFMLPYYRELTLGQITKFTTKMISLAYHHRGYMKEEMHRVYAQDVVKAPPEMTL